MSTKICYVIGAWSGGRRFINKFYLRDPAYFLRTQMKFLGELKHNLSAVVVVAPHDPEKPEGFERYLRKINGKSVRAPVIVLRRPNIGASYGSWQHAYDLFKGEYTHYMFVEDDYVPVVDNFDQKFLDLMEAKEGCGAVFTLMFKVKGTIMVGAISNCLIADWAMKRVDKKVHAVLEEKLCINNYQLNWTRAIIEKVPSRDITEKYAVCYRPYRGRKKIIRFYGDRSKPMLIAPVEWLEYKHDRENFVVQSFHESGRPKES